jgi:hypothetical protein
MSALLKKPQTNPIEVAKNRESMRVAKHRLDSARGIEAYLNRISLTISDKERIANLLKDIQEEARKDYESSLKREAELLNRVSASETSGSPVAA